MLNEILVISNLYLIGRRMNEWTKGTEPISVEPIGVTSSSPYWYLTSAFPLVLYKPLRENFNCIEPTDLLLSSISSTPTHESVINLYLNGTFCGTIILWIKETISKRHYVRVAWVASEVIEILLCSQNLNNFCISDYFIIIQKQTIYVGWQSLKEQSKINSFLLCVL